LNTVVIGFGTVSQAYGICLFLIAAAFRFITKAVAESRSSLFVLSGLCAGASAGCSLLTAPVLPILLAWAAWYSTDEWRFKNSTGFFVGTLIAFSPLICLASLAPYQMFFNTFEYHFFYRAVSNWQAYNINLNTLIGLFHSRQFLLLMIFAGVGLFVLNRSQWDAGRKAEFYLCGWLAAGLGAFLSTVKITFHQYFVLSIPFLSILASVGIVAAGSWLRAPGRPVWLVLAVLAVFVAEFPFWLWQQHKRLHWSQLEAAAKVINDITPLDGLLWAHEAIYFAAQRTPPSGLEHADSLKLRLPPSESALLHVMSRADLNDLVAAGRFATIASCWATEEWIDAVGLRKVYNKRTTVDGCDVFWSRALRQHLN
jgi:hypothetical protein